MRHLMPKPPEYACLLVLHSDQVISGKDKEVSILNLEKAMIPIVLMVVFGLCLGSHTLSTASRMEYGCKTSSYHPIWC